MRRDSKVNPKLSKIIARKKYAERQIDKWVKWSWQQRGKDSLALPLHSIT